MVWHLLLPKQPTPLQLLLSKQLAPLLQQPLLVLSVCQYLLHQLKLHLLLDGKNRPTERTYFVRDEVTKTEILCLLAVHRHQSVRDVSSLVDLLPLLFPDSEIASGVKLHKTKVSYGISYGLAPYFKEQLRETLLKCDMFAVGFDESLNKVSQNQQMDLVVRFWHPDKNEVCTRCLTSVFLGKSAATDILIAFQNGLTGFDLKKMVQSMASFVELFLTEFQGNKPLTPFLYSKLYLLVKYLLQRFVKPSVLNSSNAFSMYKINLNDKQNLLKVEYVDIGFATKAAFKKCKNVSSSDVEFFRSQCLVFMEGIVVKLLEKSPLSYSFTRSMSCLVPQKIASDDALANKRLSAALTYLTELNRMSGDTADAISRKYKNLIGENVVKQQIKLFNKEDRLDHFWVRLIDSRLGYANLLSFIKLICILFHGNASLERGFL
ncbi:hypothetical protein JTE90_023424 [Oedothorax gibbosus]|uniref:Uncharacterized protein n=1 Tax=Oedothorax gibbosus TaxID=931172 RepID=A0AAV6U4J8_9ARAC|nr:hypothetical protein JTE90_023424 [Oedothorax gibbosus]